MLFRSRALVVFVLVSLLLALLPFSRVVVATTTTQSLPFQQAWTNTGEITADDDWSGVAGVIGYRGDDLTTSTGTDPQTIVADGSATPVDVIANQTNTNLITGGIAEFHLTNPVVALQGSGTADAPHLVIAVDTTGRNNVTVSYNLRDIDGSADNAVQQVALQYRVGSTGNFTNLPAGFVADATTGPSLATSVTPVSVVLPTNASDQPRVEVRILTTNAVGSDEWVGVDDISVTGSTITADLAPGVASTSPASGATNVPVHSNITITFSEAVNVTGEWFSIGCESSDGHAASVTGGPTTFTLDPDSDFANAEVCTVTVFASQVTDQDANDPPDNMAANHTFTFTTVGATRRIREIQGAAHTSPLTGELVGNVPGIVTAKRSNGFYIQDPSTDDDPATSEAILVFTNSPPTSVSIGDSVTVHGRVAEFRPGCILSCDPTSSAFSNLTTTEITAPAITVVSQGHALPATTVIGSGGRIPPSMVIEDDASDGNVETSGIFDPDEDGIDFYESLEAMRVQVNDAVAVGPRNAFREIWVVGDNSERASVDTVRGGVVIGPADFNPERIQLDDSLLLNSTPQVNVGDGFTTPVVGILDYDFGNFEVNVTSALTRVEGGIEREATRAPLDHEIVVGTYNVENLDPSDTSFAVHAALIVNNLRSPDLIAIEEIQDNNGAVNDSVTDASVTWGMLIAAIQAAGGPTYDYRQIDPVDDQDGGQPGGNIRVGFLFRTDRGLEFIDRPGGDSTTPVAVVDHPSGPQLSASPGRIIDPESSGFDDTRKPLAGEFRANGKKLFVIANHFSSKGGDQPLFGRFQPPTRSSEVQRHEQARIVNVFVDEILEVDPSANVIVLGDINDFEFSETVEILEDGVLTSLMHTLPPGERYSYVFEGNSQVLDQILVSDNLLDNFSIEYDPVHVNSEFADQASDHDPQVARFDLRGRRTPKK